MEEVVIVSAVRSAIGKFGGSLKDISAVNLGAIVIKEAIKRLNKEDISIDEVIMGNVLQSGLGQNVARQSAIKAGLSVTVPAVTINKVCGSGLRAISLATQIIKCGDADIIIAGGMENMSQSPYLLKNSRYGNKMGNGEIIDSMINDALTDAFNGYHMGITAENIAEKWNITRQMQDEFSVDSQKKAERAIKSGRFKDEIVPINLLQKKGNTVVFDTDEFPRFDSDVEKLSKLNAAFKKGGSVTAGNSSGINDGAAVVILMNAKRARELGIKPIAKVISYSSVGISPEIMGYSPVYAIKDALKKCNMDINKVDLIELNEAFAAQSLAIIKDLGIDYNKVNVNGGAIALGHPVGASGARILVTLINEMKKREDVQIGMASLCIGGGLGSAIIVQKY